MTLELGLVASVVAAIIIRLCTDEFRGDLRRAEIALLRRAASELGADAAARWAEEWLAEHASLDDVPLRQFAWTLSLYCRRRAMKEALGQSPATSKLRTLPLPKAPTIVELGPHESVTFETAEGALSVTNLGVMPRTVIEVVVVSDKVGISRAGYAPFVPKPLLRPRTFWRRDPYLLTGADFTVAWMPYVGASATYELRH